MITRTAFDVDCNPIIPACGYSCPHCIEEIEYTLLGRTGVNKVFMGEGAEEGLVIVEHDAAMTTVDELIDIFKALPTLHDGFFIPRVIDS